MSTAMGDQHGQHDDPTHKRADGSATGRSGRPARADTSASQATSPAAGQRSPAAERQQVVAEQKAQFGGFKWGSAFFGWLTATGAAVLLIALLAAAGTVAGMPTNGKLADKLGNQVSSGSTTAQTIGTAGAIALLVILFVSYLAGGYVAGRMARFNGLKQGLAVWLWALLIAVVVAVLGVVAGDEYNVTDQLNNFPKIPVTHGDLTWGGLIALAAIAVTSLFGALLGGLLGMRFHRRVDKAGYTA